jgi:crotonobetainyl-CoA:carnitine CoA-transferase CaiB-like acyl-CoA transferase
MPEAADNLPLAGLKVLDLSTFIAAPSAAVVLGDYGADVIKIEQPGGGDPNRDAVAFASYPDSDVNYPWQMDSRNKRSLALDLKHPQAHEVLERLVRSADVLITNLPLAVRERLKIRHEDLHPLNSRLIYASLTGYGETGPDRDQPGFDANAYYARSGYLDALRYDGDPPHFQLPASGDRATAMALVSAIMMALFRRERTGEGGMVGTSLLACGLWSNGVYAQAALVDAYLSPRQRRERPRSALANCYRTRDDRWILLTLPREEAGWPLVCKATGRPELVDDPRFLTSASRRAHAVELTRELDDAFCTQDLAYWRDQLARHRVIFSVIQRLRDIGDDQQTRHAGAVVDTAIPEMPRTIAAPIRLAGVQPRIAHRAPALGEHSDEILREAGLSNEQIDRLRAGGAVA